jgi:hypothetical protein
VYLAVDAPVSAIDPFALAELEVEALSGRAPDPPRLQLVDPVQGAERRDPFHVRSDELEQPAVIAGADCGLEGRPEARRDLEIGRRHAPSVGRPADASFIPSG